jgi:hypothetical protein
MFRRYSKQSYAETVVEVLGKRVIALWQKRLFQCERQPSVMSIAACWRLECNYPIFLNDQHGEDACGICTGVYVDSVGSKIRV